MPEQQGDVPLTKLEYKAAVKEAFKEWLDDQAAAFGWFSIKFVGCSLLAALAYMYFKSGGFK